MQKQLFLFTLKQLLDGNLHLGHTKNYWTDLTPDIIIGQRLNNYILDINLGILNLKKSLRFLEILFYKNHKILFFLKNKIYIKNIIMLRNYFTQMNFSFILTKYLAGCLTNFKNFRLKIFPKLIKFNAVVKKQNRALVPLFSSNPNFHKLLGLVNFDTLPASVVSFSANSCLINESLILGIPSIKHVNTDSSAQDLNKITYIIPLNISDYTSFLMVFNLYFNAFIMGNLKRKKIFLKMVIFILDYIKINFIDEKVFDLFTLNFSFFINFYRVIKRVKCSNKNNLNKKNLLLNKFFLFKLF